MHVDPILSALCAIAVTALLVGLVLRRFNQPHVVSYILAGMIVGPSVLGLVSNQDAITQFGGLGVVVLLFFVGLEVSPERLISKWRVALIGTLLQVALSLAVAWIAGHWFQWPVERVILLGFVITLSSTAVVLKLLQQWQQLDSRLGQNVLGILLVQDFLVVPMLITISMLSGVAVSPLAISRQVLGAVILVVFVVWQIASKRRKKELPTFLRNDPELQLFAALSLCFGLAVMTGWLELSTALGAFAAGLIVGQRYETHWLHEKLSPLRDLFVALFFLSVGLQIDLAFLGANLGPLLFMVAVVLMVNTLINAAILKTFGERWRDAVYGGVVLSQIGEFSFILTAVGLTSGLITDHGYRFILAVIALSLALSPSYILLARKALGPDLKLTADP